MAGQFYPAEAAELKKLLGSFSTNAGISHYENVRAIISPHAGYVYSGEVAASAYSRLDPGKQFERIFLLASSHRTSFTGASIYVAGNYLTPLGEVPVDIELGNKLIMENNLIVYHPEAHIAEHSNEVQLPFIQYYIRDGYKIVPIVIGSPDEKTSVELARILEPFINDQNLFVISSDFSHYPSSSDAERLDAQSAEAILANSAEAFAGIISDRSIEKVDGLATRCCGWASVLTLLNITENMPGIEYRHIMYKNSGDSPYGDKKRVVGYHSITIVQRELPPGHDFILSNKDKEVLLGLARKTIGDYILSGKTDKLEPQQFPENTHVHCGAFVTLHKDGNLRGCIGRFSADEPLFSVVQQMAIASSTQDTRFDPVVEDELQQIDIEISVLTPMKKIGSPDEIELGKHGIYLVRGNRSGTFLPQVATETGWSKEEFLGHCARDKAGIGWDGWKNAEIYTYEALVFSEKEFKKDN
ncbi:MAG: AmmeMemoRadiSam system protein B [Bacteroidales bacterium]|nr:AmmeMemoRadiSam system protein B [Bacteroidales bacterium]